jgi:hypothetical protein
MSDSIIKTGSGFTVAVLIIALIIFGTPFFLIQFWDSFEHDVPYQIIDVRDNDLEGCSSNFVTILRKPDSGITLKKCGKLGKVNQIIFIPETHQKDD